MGVSGGPAPRAEPVERRPGRSSAEPIDSSAKRGRTWTNWTCCWACCWRWSSSNCFEPFAGPGCRARRCRPATRFWPGRRTSRRCRIGRCPCTPRRAQRGRRTGPPHRRWTRETACAGATGVAGHGRTVPTTHGRDAPKTGRSATSAVRPSPAAPAAAMVAAARGAERRRFRIAAAVERQRQSRALDDAGTGPTPSPSPERTS